MTPKNYKKEGWRGVCAYCDNERLFGEDTCGRHNS